MRDQAGLTGGRGSFDDMIPRRLLRSLPIPIRSA